MSHKARRIDLNQGKKAKWILLKQNLPIVKIKDIFILGISLSQEKFKSPAGLVYSSQQIDFS